MRVIEVIRDLACQLQALIRQIAGEMGLTTTQAQVLFTLPADGMSMSALAERLGLDNSTISRIIQHMEKQHWVTRNSSLRDRRVIKVSLTPTGKQVHYRLNEILETELRPLIESLEMDRQESLEQHLEELSWSILRRRI